MEGRGGADQLKSGGGNDTVRGGDGGDQLDGGDGDDVIFGHGAQGTDPNAGAVFATRVGAGFDLPLFATSAPGDPNRLFVVEQHTGAVRIFNLTTGKIAPEAFLNIPDNEMAQGSEQGLLGFTFHPDFANNHQAFIYLSNADGDTEIRRYTGRGLRDNDTTTAVSARWPADARSTSG